MEEIYRSRYEKALKFFFNPKETWAKKIKNIPELHKICSVLFDIYEKQNRLDEIKQMLFYISQIEKFLILERNKNVENIEK